MKSKQFNVATFLLLVFLFFVQSAMADNNRKAGIGFRGTYWKMGDASQTVHVVTNPPEALVDFGNGGGYFYIFSRMGDAAWMEFTMGAVGKVESYSQGYWGEEVSVNAVTPVLLGVRQDFFSYDTESALIPYIAFGAGPYWLSEVYSRTAYSSINSEVLVKSKANIGGYAGGGVNFLLTSWLAINLDARYHFIRFDVHHEKSGWEYGLGLAFSWGKYKKYYSPRYHYHRHRRDNIHIYID
ncbi:MAG: hypothetical protein EHM72_17880 [Calditrichaeota bacterium]|nr:MAG: hypothetical protein EHM72_17880 [Calditrichota bacterium]